MKPGIHWKRALVIALSAIAIGVPAILYSLSAARAETAQDNHAGHDHPEVDPDHAEDERDHAEGDVEPGEAGHDHESEDLVKLTEPERAQVGIVVEEARLRPMLLQLNLPAEVRLDEDRLAHVVPHLSGIVVDVRGRVGEKVKKGDVLAVIESRDLADAQAESLAAASRLGLAQKTFAREKDLWEKKISAEKDYLEALRDLEESNIAVRAAHQKLTALGISGSPNGSKGASLTRYEIKAPLDAEIVEKHIVLGEFVHGESEVFVLADLQTVWVDVNVFQHDLPRIAEGQEVLLSGAPGLPDSRGTITYIAPLIDRSTRTALARIVLPNDSGQWRPGLYVNVGITIDAQGEVVAVPKAAVQRLGEQQAVFVEDGQDFALRTVTVGVANGDVVEVLSGLAPGERYVAEGAFELKAKLVTSGMGSHVGHGH